MKVYTYEHQGCRVQSARPLTPRQVAALVAERRAIEALPVTDIFDEPAWRARASDPLGFDWDGRRLVPPEE